MIARVTSHHLHSETPIPTIYYTYTLSHAEVNEFDRHLGLNTVSTDGEHIGYMWLDIKASDSIPEQHIAATHRDVARVFLLRKLNPELHKGSIRTPEQGTFHYDELYAGYDLKAIEKLVQEPKPISMDKLA